MFRLDIDYAEDLRYSMWKENGFPVEMINDVSAFGRKLTLSLSSDDLTRWSIFDQMVVILDTRLKRSPEYPVYK